MAQQEDTVISHFSHPGHELVKRHHTGSFRCDMCWEDLSGAAYGCRAGCYFAIHEACAGHPQALTSPAHHAHPLALVQTRRDVVAHQCDVCAPRCAPGCFLYRCPPCGFDMHPRCGRLPQAVRSSRHRPGHDLALVVAEARCAACHRGGAGASGWFYHCAACNVDLHVSCASAGGGDQEANNAGAAASHGGNGHVPPSTYDWNGHAPGATLARDFIAEERLRRARIKVHHNAIARISDSIDRLGWIG